ncbi:MAG: Fluoroacetyl-CoA thioesterase [Verrucomicrobiota bacterium]|jgi:predicted thioesterase
MTSRPHPGLSGEHTFTVEERHCIDFAEAGMPAVLSTPQLIGLLERTARQALASCLEADERSVGMEVDLRHLAPTPCGAKVTLLARVIRAEGREVTFHVEARDAQEVLARGVHRRAVIKVPSFARRVAAKAAAVMG